MLPLEMDSDIGLGFLVYVWKKMQLGGLLPIRRCSLKFTGLPEVILAVFKWFKDHVTFLNEDKTSCGYLKINIIMKQRWDKCNYFWGYDHFGFRKVGCCVKANFLETSPTRWNMVLGNLGKGYCFLCYRWTWKQLYLMLSFLKFGQKRTIYSRVTAYQCWKGH